jgi:membrane protease YdiL (CAAX protease family)
MTSVERARRGLLIFVFALTGTTSLLIYFLWSELHSLPLTQKILLLSFTPAISSLIARMALREGLDDVSFRLKGDLRNAQSLVIAWLWPVAAGMLTYGLAWVTGVVQFRLTCAGPPFGNWGPEKLVGLSVVTVPALTGFFIRLASCLLFSLVCCIQTFGEEVGWRGYLLTLLIDAKVTMPIFWNGLLWGLCTFPVCSYGLLVSHLNRHCFLSSSL